MVQKKKHTRISSPGLTELPSLPLDAPALIHDYRRYFTYTLGQNKYSHSVKYFYKALALTVRDRLMERWKKTRYSYVESRCKQGYYLSLEFLMGRTLGNAMLNLGITDAAAQAMHELGINLEDLAEAEIDAGLGNGGLGRLAACFLDSCATLRLPGMGAGIGYDYGMFRQRVL